MSRTEKELKSYQSALAVFLSAIIEKEKSTPFNLSVNKGQSMFAERDMMIAAAYVSDMMRHASYTNEEIELYLTDRINRYYSIDITKGNTLPNLNYKPNTPESALALLAQIMFIAEPTLSSLLAENINHMESLFIVGFEGAYDWSDWTTCLEHDDFEQGRSFTTFYSSELTTDCGWSDEETEELKNLPLFDMLHCYSSQSHTMVKIA